MMCKLYPKCEAAADADFTVVEKTAQADCTVEVKGASVDVKEKGDCTYDEEDADPFTCELNQVYYQVARDEFRTKFNESRIKYHPEQTCTGWVLSQNRKATRLIMKYTLLDADEDVLNEYRTFWREILNPGVANNVPLPGCEQLGTDEVMDGKPDSWSCDDDVVLRKLCAASCLDTTTEVIADTANCAAIGGCDCAAACTCTDPEDECSDDGTGVSHGDQRIILLLWLCPKSCQRSPSRPKPH